MSDLTKQRRTRVGCPLGEKFLHTLLVHLRPREERVEEAFPGVPDDGKVRTLTPGGGDGTTQEEATVHLVSCHKDRTLSEMPVMNATAAGGKCVYCDRDVKDKREDGEEGIMQAGDPTEAAPDEGGDKVLEDSSGDPKCACARLNELPEDLNSDGGGESVKSFPRIPARSRRRT